jgi:ribosomal protein S18 acetylase RimI-like enzyme
MDTLRRVGCGLVGTDLAQVGNFKRINPSRYLIGRICHEKDTNHVVIITHWLDMPNLNYRFFQRPSPLWKSAIKLRYEVFVLEQKVPEEMEIDAYDETAHHMLVQDSNQNAVGVMRIVVKGTTGKIGRVAVAGEYRHQGIGTEMMLKV